MSKKLLEFNSYLDKIQNELNQFTLKFVYMENKSNEIYYESETNKKIKEFINAKIVIESNYNKIKHSYKRELDDKYSIVIKNIANTIKTIQGIIYNIIDVKKNSIIQANVKIDPDTYKKEVNLQKLKEELIILYTKIIEVTDDDWQSVKGIHENRESFRQSLIDTYVDLIMHSYLMSL